MLLDSTTAEHDYCVYNYDQNHVSSLWSCFFQTRLAELYSSSADDADRRNTELVEGVEQLQHLVARVTQEKEELSVQLVEETSR